MPLTEPQRIALHRLVDACRDDLKQAVAERLQAVFGIHSDGKIEPETALSLPDEETVTFRHRLVTHIRHRSAQYAEPDSEDSKLKAVERLTREAAFTHLNRLCAYKMLAARKVIDDPIGRGIRSRGFLFYAAESPEIEALIASGRQERAFRLFLEWQAAQLAPEMEALFSQDDPAAGLYPSQLVLDHILERMNADDLKPVWEDDETIGWVYQFFTTDDERKRLRKEHSAPVNAYEMAVRNQFFTPRYIVEFLADNTLGRTWIEMCEGQTALTEQCRYLLRETQEALPRPKKDPREIRVLDPACGSGHFLLYAFELFLTIYAEAYEDPEAGKHLRENYPERQAFDLAVPALIMEHNLWGVDIDRRCAQIAALALSLRAERAWQEQGLKREERPRITKTNIVCAEPMPGEEDLFADFARSLDPPLLADLVRSVFEKMQNADTLGSLLKIEDDLRETIAEAKQKYAERGKSAVQMSLEIEQARPVTIQRTLDVESLADESFFEDAEERVLKALQQYAEQVVVQEDRETVGLSRRLFAGDAAQGFAFVDLCSQKFDVVLMNPPFGDAATPSKHYIEATYGDTKGDVYKAFVECFQDRLVPGGYLGAITNRTGFFLGQSADWRERVVLRLYRPLVMADLGAGVLDAMVETAAYVLRSLTEEDRRALTLSLAERLSVVKVDKSGRFTRAGYQKTFDLKRHQAEQELDWLVTDNFVSHLPGEISATTGKPGLSSRT